MPKQIHYVLFTKEDATLPLGVITVGQMTTVEQVEKRVARALWECHTSEHKAVLCSITTPLGEEQLEGLYTTTSQETINFILIKTLKY